MDSFDGEPTKLRDWIKLIEKCILIARDKTTDKKAYYLNQQGAFRDYIQKYMADYPENSWKQLKSELNVIFAEVNYPHCAFTMLHKARQDKHESLQDHAERLYTLANDSVR